MKHWMARLAAPAVVLMLLLMPSARGQVVQKEFDESDAFIMNPDCGWVAYNYEDSYAFRTKLAGGREPFDLASVVYTRHVSAAWQDRAGGYEFSAPVRLLQDWMDNGRDVAFRIFANRMEDLPGRLQERVEAVEYEEGGKLRRGIAYWDEDYIADHRRLVEFLGRRFGRSPYLAFVDIGAVGNTGGEWYFSPRGPFERAGLSDDRFLELVRTFVDMYREAFPRTRLYISYECVAKAGQRRQDVIDLLTAHDIGVRDDGLGGWPFPRESTPVALWPMPILWQRVPACFEAGGRGGGVYGLVRQGKDPVRVLDWVIKRCPPTYINLGGAETNSQKACDEQRSLLERYGRRLGYRLVLLRASVAAELERGRAAELQMRWANRGVAPCYSDHRAEVSLFDQDGRFVVALAGRPVPAVREWAPGQEVAVRLPFVVPASVAPGEYSLKVRLLLGSGSGHTRFVRVATEGADGEGRYTVGTVRVGGSGP